MCRTGIRTGIPSPSQKIVCRGLVSYSLFCSSSGIPAKRLDSGLCLSGLLILRAGNLMNVMSWMWWMLNGMTRYYVWLCSKLMDGYGWYNGSVVDFGAKSPIPLEDQQHSRAFVGAPGAQAYVGENKKSPHLAEYAARWRGIRRDTEKNTCRRIDRTR